MENSAPELSGPVEYQAEYGKLECVLLDKDPLDMAVLVDMGMDRKGNDERYLISRSTYIPSCPQVPEKVKELQRGT